MIVADYPDTSGEINSVYATVPVADSAQQLAPFVDKVRSTTCAKQVDLVGHSQGGMMPRYYMDFLGGAKNVHHLIGILPSNHGTEGLIVPQSGVVPDPNCTGVGFAARADQVAGSAFMQKLNSIGDTVAGPSYTVIATVNDEVVIPHNSQLLNGPARQVSNITIQDKCPADPIEHDQTPNDPVVHWWPTHWAWRPVPPIRPTSPTASCKWRRTGGPPLQQPRHPVPSRIANDAFVLTGAPGVVT